MFFYTTQSFQINFKRMWNFLIVNKFINYISVYTRIFTENIFKREIESPCSNLRVMFKKKKTVVLFYIILFNYNIYFISFTYHVVYTNKYVCDFRFSNFENSFDSIIVHWLTYIMILQYDISDIFAYDLYTMTTIISHATRT